WNRVKRIAKNGVLYNLSIMGAIAIIVVLVAEYGVRLFIQEENAVTFGTQYLQVIDLCFPFLGINFVLHGIVRASGAMYQVLNIMIVAVCILRFPLTDWFATVSGEIGIDIGMGISFIISSIVESQDYREGKWREKE